MSTISGLQTALQALLAHQQVIQTIEHNVANVNTPGYHRQEAVLKAGVPTGYSYLQGFNPGEDGTGVTVDTIKRYNVNFIDARYRAELGGAKRWGVESQVLNQIEATLDETGSGGLVAKLDAFWKGWQTLSTDPTNPSLRADLLEQANTLVNAVQGRNTQLNQIRIDQNQGITVRADEINSLASQVANINVQVAQLSNSDQQPNDLLDQRDQMVDRLVELTGARADAQPNGLINVSVNGHTLVQGGSVMKVIATPGPITTALAWEDGQAFTPTDGEITGLLDLRDSVIPNFQHNLDQLAYSVATEVNQIHNPTTPGNDPPYGAPGKNFFNGVTGVDGAAGMISVNPEMNDLTNILGASAAYPEDGTIARLIGGLRQTQLAGLNNTSMNEFYTQKSAELGFFTKKAETYTSERNNIADTLNQQREAVEGVSLDEEGANLIKAQKAFQAATRLVSIEDEMLDRIINGMGAGR